MEFDSVTEAIRSPAPRMRWRAGTLAVLLTLTACQAIASGSPTPTSVLSPSGGGDSLEPGPSSGDQPSGSADVDLTGRWDDNGREVEITQVGNEVTASYVDIYTCEHQDGTGESSTTGTDFVGTREGNTLTGEVNTCSVGSDNPLGVGITPAPLTLTINADGTVLTGTWYSELEDQDVPITLTRLD